MSSTSSSNISTPSSTASASGRVYDFATMMKLATSSASSTSSTTALVQLQDFPDIVKEESDLEEDEIDESYGSGEDLRTDLSDAQLRELKQAVHDALTPLTSTLPLPLTPPPQQPRSAPIVQTTRNNLLPPSQFQSRAFATPHRKSQSQYGAFGRDNQRMGSNASNWRRDTTRNSNPREGFGRPKPFEVRSNESTATSWRKIQPGTEWKYNENTSGYTLIEV